MKEGLNIWRVYADLFTNMAGLILAGGLGMMVLFGGALQRRHPSDDAFPRGCGNLEFVEAGFARAGHTMAREDCKTTVEDAGVYFRFADLAPQEPDKARRLCRPLAFSASVIGERGVVEVIGHASADIEKENPQCRALAADLGADDPVKAQRQQVQLCNHRLAMIRAAGVVAACRAQIEDGDLDELLASDVTTLDDPQRRAVADRIVPGSHSTLDEALSPACVDENDDGKCHRHLEIVVSIAAVPGA